MSEENFTKISETSRKLLVSLLEQMAVDKDYKLGIEAQDLIKKLQGPQPDYYLHLESGTDEMSDDRVSGFVRIKNLGNAQQTLVSTKRFATMAKLVGDLRAEGFDEVWVTVQDDRPLVIGGKTMGFALAPREH